MIRLNPFFAIIMISISFSLMGCASNSKTKRINASFETKAEAEKAAKNFNCTGAHKMGDKWMPCQSHSDHEEVRNHKFHSEHNHHH